MSLRGLKSAVGDRWRHTRAGLRGCAIALTYHRVADLDSDPQLLAVSTAHFAEQMAVLAAHYETLTATELVDAMRTGGRLPRRAVVVTLDDGYADNLTNAKPILADNGVRATAFLASGPLESGEAYWWDRLQDLVFSPSVLPPHLELEGVSCRFVASLSNALAWESDDVARHAGWTVLDPPPTDRHRLFLALADWLRSLAPQGRARALTELSELLGAPAPAERDARLLSPADLAELEAGGTVEIGAHTVNHALLSALGPDAQREEIGGGKRALERLAGHPVSVLSYPHGGPGDFDTVSADAARDAGFTGAFTTLFGTVVPWADRYAIPRCHTENINGEAFHSLLEGWFDAGR